MQHPNLCMVDGCSEVVRSINALFCEDHLAAATVTASRSSTTAEPSSGEGGGTEAANAAPPARTAPPHYEVLRADLLMGFLLSGCERSEANLNVAVAMDSLIRNGWVRLVKDDA